MEQSKIDTFVKEKGKFFAKDSLQILIGKLKDEPDSSFDLLMAQKYKKPGIMPILTWLLGFLGVDRFMLGDTGLGVFKLLTGGGFIIFNLFDIFTACKRTRNYNFDLAIKVL